MKWLKSTSQKSWVASAGGKQIIIPQAEPSDKWLQISENDFAEISKQPVINSLIKAGSIMVLDEEPAELKNSVPALQVTNTQLQAELDTAKLRITQLEAQLKDASGVDIEAIKAEVRQQCEEEKQNALKELDDKASQMLADKDKEIAKLEKKLKKLGDSSEE